MLPTFNPRGDVLIQEHLSVIFRQIRVGERSELTNAFMSCMHWEACCQYDMHVCISAGDVVFAVSKNDPRHVVCKRILGMAGDTVEVRDGKQGALRLEKVSKKVGQFMHLQIDEALHIQIPGSGSSRSCGPMHNLRCGCQK